MPVLVSTAYIVFWDLLGVNTVTALHYGDGSSQRLQIHTIISPVIFRCGIDLMNTWRNFTALTTSTVIFWVVLVGKSE